MKTQDNNILIILLKSWRKLTYSIPTVSDPQEAAMKCMYAEDIKEKDVERFYFIKDPSYSATTFQDNFSIDRGLIDELAEVKSKKAEMIRKHRNLILNKLDVQFLISLENDCPDCTNHIKEIKQYLRDLPQLFMGKEFTSTNEILNFNSFDNVFDIEITNPGAGYTQPPTITIDPPQKNETPGFRMEAEAEIEDGKITNIKTTQVGSSYLYAPLLEISTPDGPDGILARAVTSEPENNIYHYLEQGLKNAYNIDSLFFDVPINEQNKE
jgi:hypothetical protein